MGIHDGFLSFSSIVPAGLLSSTYYNTFLPKRKGEQSAYSAPSGRKFYFTYASRMAAAQLKGTEMEKAKQLLLEAIDKYYRDHQKS